MTDTTVTATTTKTIDSIDQRQPPEYEYEYYYYDDDDYGDPTTTVTTVTTDAFGFVTETVTGFADFVTTIGNTVVVFTPEGDAGCQGNNCREEYST